MNALQAPLSRGILQSRMLRWVTMHTSRGSSQHRGWSQASHISSGLFTVWAIREAWQSHTHTHTHTLIHLHTHTEGERERETDSLEKTLMLEGLKAEREEGDRGWDGWMASPMQWAWVWENSGRRWGTGRPGKLQSLGLWRVGYDLMTEKQQLYVFNKYKYCFQAYLCETIRNILCSYWRK